MSWYELLLTLHILGAGLWLGSGIAITVITYRLASLRDTALGPFMSSVQWWAGRAHPAASVVILLAGFGMVADADLSLGETWIVLGLIGWVIAGALGGRFIGPTAEKLVVEAGPGGGGVDVKATADRLLLFMRIESALLVVLIAIMVSKPG